MGERPEHIEVYRAHRGAQPPLHAGWHGAEEPGMGDQLELL